MKKAIPFALVTMLIFSSCGATDDSRTKKSLKENLKPAEYYIMAGKIDTEDQATISSKISAKVLSISVDVGTKVNKGDVLIQLDTTDIATQVRQAEAAVSTAEAVLQNIMAGSRPEQIVQAQVALESSKKNYETIKNSFEKTQKLYNDAAVSFQEFQSAQSTLTAAQAQYKSAQSQLDILKQGATKETINISKKQLLQTQAALEVSKTQLSYGTIVSPVSGTVASKNIKVGEFATPTAPLISIVSSENMYVKAYLPENLIGQIKEEQIVAIKVTQLSDKKYDGKIAVISPVVNSQNKNMFVKVLINNPDTQIKPGMYAEIAIKEKVGE